MFLPEWDVGLTRDDEKATGAGDPDRRVIELEFDSLETVNRFVT